MWRSVAGPGLGAVGPGIVVILLIDGQSASLVGTRPAIFVLQYCDIRSAADHRRDNDSGVGARI